MIGVGRRQWYAYTGTEESIMRSKASDKLARFRRTIVKIGSILEKRDKAYAGLRAVHRQYLSHVRDLKEKVVKMRRVIAKKRRLVSILELRLKRASITTKDRVQRDVGVPEDELDRRYYSRNVEAELYGAVKVVVPVKYRNAAVRVVNALAANIPSVGSRLCLSRRVLAVCSGYSSDRVHSFSYALKFLREGGVVQHSGSSRGPYELTGVFFDYSVDDNTNS